MGFRKILGRFCGDERGAIAIWAAFSTPMIFGIGALAFDMNQMYTTKAQLQHTADAAAVAAAKALPDQAAAIAAAQHYAQLNMPSASNGTVVAPGDVITGNWDSASRTFTPAGAPANAVRVNARRDQQNGNPMATSIAAAIGVSSVNVSTSSIAALAGSAGSGPVCILALEPSAGKALWVRSNAQITAHNCDIQVNSASSNALYADSNALVAVSAGDVCAYGGYVARSNSHITPPPTTGSTTPPCAPIVDPLEGLAAPASASGPCDYNNYQVDENVETLNPGVYCGGLSIRNNSVVALNPGIYVIKGGVFEFESNSEVTGAGVFIYLADGAYINFNSNTTFTASAPDSGPYEGILLFAEPGNNLTHYMESNTVSLYDGLFYLPGDKLLVNSNASISNGANFTYLIAKTFNLDSNGHLFVDSAVATVTPPAMAGLGASVQLVK